jgi:hypothetical protein
MQRFSYLAQRLHAVRPWMVSLVVCVFYIAAVLIQNQGNALVLVTLPEPPSSKHPHGFEGYDGQFTYAIAIDPVASPASLDVPAYRLQRILLPMLGRILALGQTELVPWSILMLNIAALVGGTYIMESLLATSGANTWLALVYGIFPGVLMPVRVSLNEPLAYGLALAAIWASQQERWNWSAALLALAALTKETALIFTLGYLLWFASRRQWRDAIRYGLIACVPFALWQGVLLIWLGRVGVGSGGNYSTPFEMIPFMGLWRISSETDSPRVIFAYAVVMASIAVIPGIWGIVAGVRDLFQRLTHPYIFLLLANAMIIPFTPYSTFRELLGMLRFLPGLVIAILLYGAHFHRRRMILFCSLLWVASLATALISG